MSKKSFSSLARLTIGMIVLLLGVANAEDLSPGKDWVTLDHATLTRTDKTPGIDYEVVTATLYGKRLANGTVVPKLLVLREKTAERCADATCGYRYAGFALGLAENRGTEIPADTRRFLGRPVALDGELTKYQPPASHVVSGLTLMESTATCGKRTWLLKTKLEEGAHLQFTGEAIAARPNPKFIDPSVRRP